MFFITGRNFFCKLEIRSWSDLKTILLFPLSEGYNVIKRVLDSQQHFSSKSVWIRFCTIAKSPSAGGCFSELRWDGIPSRFCFTFIQFVFINYTTKYITVLYLLYRMNKRYHSLKYKHYFPYRYCIIMQFM